MFGMLIGSLLIGILADIIGRKKSLLMSILGASVFFFAGAFVTNFWAYAIIRFLCGIFAKGLFFVSFVIGVEIVGADYAPFLGILIQVNLVSDFYS